MTQAASREAAPHLQMCAPSAAFTAGAMLPRPIATCRYWHRSLSPKKLIDIGFSRLAVRTQPFVLAWCGFHGFECCVGSGKEGGQGTSRGNGSVQASLFNSAIRCVPARTAWFALHKRNSKPPSRSVARVGLSKVALSLCVLPLLKPCMARRSILCMWHTLASLCV
eukprot:1160062-Pelagomonas_calceolata.AAC.4